MKSPNEFEFPIVSEAGPCFREQVQPPRVEGLAKVILPELNVHLALAVSQPNATAVDPIHHTTRTPRWRGQFLTSDVLE